MTCSGKGPCPCERETEGGASIGGTLANLRPEVAGEAVACESEERPEVSSGEHYAYMTSLVGVSDSTSA
jgi:hypothetical protein